ncbi:molecular chaperone GrpE (heat shock protein) [Cylindrospermum stagnale PCC 7417]|uniref:Molecular chaperone GrpE (Heat shock protein) n=1 Tax=Cylindrospermum stagnale PCC 7417 TaxID=56107 RepID=K9X233_9NOST|nr:nucleotide exchange factor GrpE [Cylindrospermum stagnale]AFZ26528.1 molecular chaperone GrpE (heat shock protein) [Cylindrospermum stagnale PCC 7417]
MHSSLDSQNPQIDFTHPLQNLMQRVGVSSFKSLSRAAGVSERQILRLRRGELEQMRVDGVLKLSQVLQISLSELVETFSVPNAVVSAGFTQHRVLSLKSEPSAVVSAGRSPCRVLSMEEEKQPDLQLSTHNSTSEQELLHRIADLQREYQRILLVLEQQREVLLQEFQQSSLHSLETLLLQWPTAAQKAQENPQLAAVKIVPLVQKSLENLLQTWGIQAIAPVGAELPYNPQLHQLMAGSSQLGETVKVRYTGYRQGEKLLYRAKVSPM